MRAILAGSAFVPMAVGAIFAEIMALLGTARPESRLGSSLVRSILWMSLGMSLWVSLRMPLWMSLGMARCITAARLGFAWLSPMRPVSSLRIPLGATVRSALGAVGGSVLVGSEGLARGHVEL
jgi:hypothetical protein